MFFCVLFMTREISAGMRDDPVRQFSAIVLPFAYRQEKRLPGHAEDHSDRSMEVSEMRKYCRRIGDHGEEFAARMDLSEMHVSQLINGEIQLTPDVAVRLETVLGVPAKFWNNLEAIYREKLLMVEAENSKDEDRDAYREDKKRLL